MAVSIDPYSTIGDVLDRQAERFAGEGRTGQRGDG